MGHHGSSFSWYAELQQQSVWQITRPFITPCLDPDARHFQGNPQNGCEYGSDLNGCRAGEIEKNTKEALPRGKRSRICFYVSLSLSLSEQAFNFLEKKGVQVCMIEAWPPRMMMINGRRNGNYGHQWPKSPAGVLLFPRILP